MVWSVSEMEGFIVNVGGCNHVMGHTHTDSSCLLHHNHSVVFGSFYDIFSVLCSDINTHEYMQMCTHLPPTPFTINLDLIFFQHF